MTEGIALKEIIRQLKIKQDDLRTFVRVYFIIMVKLSFKINKTFINNITKYKYEYYYSRINPVEFRDHCCHKSAITFPYIDLGSNST